jgi:hypothetical protein
MRRLWIVLAVVAVAAMTLGLSRGEWTTVNKWSHTLCTSCVGLSEVE